MKVVDVYKQYFEAKCTYHEAERNAVMIVLTATSDHGMIKYEVGVTFFPHKDPEDFAITYDAYADREIFNAKGRRSKKREETMLADIRNYAEEIAGEIGGVIFWERPLTDARRG